MRRALLVAALAAGALVGLAPAASAHPLGNFTVNFADRIAVGADSVQVFHSVDTAEIPTLQLQQSADGPDADHDGTSTDAELETWATRTCGSIAPQLTLTLDGTRAALTSTAAAARFVPGQAGLPTSRLDCTFDSGRAAGRTVAFSDPTSAGRTGWKEVSASALCGSLSGTGGLPESSPSKDLTAYPQDLLSSPLDVTRASFSVVAGGACREDTAAATLPSRVLPRGVDRITTSYTAFVGRQHLTLPVALLAVLFSIALGCGHAVAPGHGKTVIAAYLVGQRGTKRQALWLGATVTATHTAGVLLLGALLSLTAVAAPERFVPATEVASGLLLAGVGVFLLRRALAARRALDHDHDHDHGADGHGAHDEHDAHDHDGHDHPHPHPHPHGAHDHPTAGHDHPHPHDDPHPHDHPHDDPHPHDHQHDHGPAELVPVGAGAAGDGRLLTATPAPSPAPAHGAAPLVHSHGGRAHTHLPVADAPIGWRTLATMGIAGGLVPSPSALVVLLGASALGRPVFGGILVVGYGMGMALTLTLAGLLLLRAQAVLGRRGWLSGRGATALRVLPVGTAIVVLVVGTYVILRGINTFRGLG